ncbi:MAG: GNAT family N-acetyltransferase [Chitinophagaceae bacterium]|nr:GNAT family N-acetyltransferase [Chitinophagaceae bacterium]
MANQIHYIENSHINRQQWDACMDASVNRLIYGYSWYLDPIATHWDALVLNDYEAIMPLTWNSKWGIRYLYQPPFTQQLGIFSPLDIPPETVELFLKELRGYFRFSEIFLNYGNIHSGVRQHTNYMLPLNEHYEQIRRGYKSSLIKNLNRCVRFQLQYKKDLDVKTALNLYKQTYNNRTPHVKASDYLHFESLCLSAQSKGKVLVRAALGEQEQLLAVSVLLLHHQRMYLLQSTTLPEGRKLEANHFLLDSLVREFAGTGVILDFEGSDIPGIAYYYGTFGSVNQPYFFYRHNALPWWIKWLKGN